MNAASSTYQPSKSEHFTVQGNSLPSLIFTWPIAATMEPDPLELARMPQEERDVVLIEYFAQKQQKMISESIRNADTAKLAPPLNETELVQQLVSLHHQAYMTMLHALLMKPGLTIFAT